MFNNHKERGFSFSIDQDRAERKIIGFSQGMNDLKNALVSRIQNLKSKETVENDVGGDLGVRNFNMRVSCPACKIDQKYSFRGTFEEGKSIGRSIHNEVNAGECGFEPIFDLD
jgi:hypothetical protein